MDSSLRGWRDWRRVLLFFGSRAAYPGHSNLACSRRSDRGDGAKRCEQKKNTLFFSRSLPSRRTPLSERLERATTIPLATHANGWRYLTSEPSAPGDKWILRVKCSAFRTKKVLSLYCRSGSSIIVCTEIETACFQYMSPIYLLHIPAVNDRETEHTLPATRNIAGLRRIFESLPRHPKPRVPGTSVLLAFDLSALKSTLWSTPFSRLLFARL